MDLLLLLIMFWLMSGVFGITYLSVVIGAFLIIKLIRPYVVSYYELAALLVPIAIYLFLTHAIFDRQGFNWGYANLLIAIPAVITLYLGTCQHTAYWIGVIVTILAAFAAWQFVPLQGMTKLF